MSIREDSELAEVAAEDQIQVSEDGRTCWVHALDGSTVGRFSKSFGIDVHRTMTEQLSGAGQCLDCTHEPPGADDWVRFIELMKQHYQIIVPPDLISFPAQPTASKKVIRPR